MLSKSELTLHDDYFILHLSGIALPADKIKENMERVISFCVENKIKKGIIYRSEPVRQTTSILDFHSLSDFLSSQGLHGYRFALVFPKEPNEDKIGAFETFALNRGVYFKRFSTLQEAKDWMQD